MSYKLVYQYQGQNQSYPLAGSSASIGRGPENEIVIIDPSVSRKHATLAQRGELWHVIDAGSRNGVKLNGAKIEPGERNAQPLRDGDILTLGAFPFKFSRDEEEKVILADSGAEVEEVSGTIVKQVSDFKDLINTSGAATALPKEAEEVVSRAKKILNVMTMMGQRIVAVKPLEEIIDSIIDLVFESTPAERASLLLWDGAAQKLVTKIARSRTGRDVGEFRISRTIVNKVYNERCAILTTDAQMDARFSAGESIRMMGIRSAAAVPLWDQTKVIGVIYADSSLLTAAFDRFNLDLLSALANYAAIAIEQARLLTRIQQEERAREKLGRYHSPAVINRILASAESSSGFNVDAQEAEVTVMYCDMVGFTSASERMTPREVMIMLNDYFSRMTELIFDNEGTLDKYIGDCIMAVFGAPLTQPDHARRAALTALGMREVVVKMNERRESQMNFRVGMNSGKVVAGDIGSAKRMEWTVLGSAVNLASRMESSVAKAGQIVMTEFTKAHLGDEFIVQSIGFQRPKGISRDIEVFELVGAK